MSEQTRIALRAARKCIQTDRAALHACHFDPAIGRVDDTGQMALAEYDAVLAQIDAALAAPAKLTDEPALPEPDAVRCEWNDGWYQWHCDRDPMPASDEWNEPPQRMLTAYFADQLRTYAAEYSAPLRAEIERLTAALAAAEADARRYRWLRAQTQLELRSDGAKWTRPDGSTFIASHCLCSGGTQFAAAATLDDTVDTAIDAAKEKP